MRRNITESYKSPYTVSFTDIETERVSYLIFWWAKNRTAVASINGLYDNPPGIPAEELPSDEVLRAARFLLAEPVSRVEIWQGSGDSRRLVRVVTDDRGGSHAAT